MKKNMAEYNMAEGSEYKEECIFTSIDIFNGDYNYLNFHYICEITFDDFSFISPYHCYFFLRNKYEALENIKNNYLQNTGNSISNHDYLKVINEKKSIELFENKQILYYNQDELSSSNRKALDAIADVINGLAIDDLIVISVYLGENPQWDKHKLMWMEMIQRDKFRRYQTIRENLRNTEKREIIYKIKSEEFDKIENKNMIKDMFYFGTYERKGQNNLGRIYMNIRNDIINNNEIYSWVLTNCNLQTDKNLIADIFIEEKYIERTIIDTVKSDNIKSEEKIENYSFSSKEYISFGKNSQNDIICLNPSISRFHCILFFSKDFHLYLIDVGSKSRTKLNNNIIKINEKYKINNNDIITLGVSKRTYKININVDKVLSYLDNKKNEAQKKIKVINEEIEYPLKNKNLLKLKVSNIYYKCNENDIIDFFKDCGEIKNMHMYNVPIINKEEGVENENNNKDDFNKMKKKKFLKQAIIEVYDENTSANIIKKNDSFLYGRKIHIEYHPLQQHKYRDKNFSTKKKFENFDIQVTCKNDKYNGEQIIIKGEHPRYKKFKRSEPGEYQRFEERRVERRTERGMERRGQKNRRKEEETIGRSKGRKRRDERSGSSRTDRSERSGKDRSRRSGKDRSERSGKDRSRRSGKDRSESSRIDRGGRIGRGRSRSSRTDRSGSSRTDRSGSSRTDRSGSSRTDRSGSSRTDRSGSSRTDRSESSSSSRDKRRSSSRGKRSSSSRGERGGRSRDGKKRDNKYSNRYSIESRDSHKRYAKKR
ncbi:FHA domain-containing protein, putative [Plasmodium yoelii]|uniref:FHA domain-containing protein n=3 Tax=Plasmodium yoelii TaxID=5861 RepID=A0AAE9WR87_PLAYO|nr:FHA domain-containing protein, putative [Plasmodium yoelii]WBY57260.1 FHA domain-containing protein [Plasmodium yoelii yoelii]CDU17936.1 conserved Plasmodium protein, unknown function [Plasmodium yoelii]VTZ78353.1 FHA domain-containing protein, putative [Plasmodium yoelii]|eukprot:XP_022812168.1 FHA domain-containing protein, putative [Plasmodium yoelii]